jgi:polyisoprenoid-binding protein YceI
MTAATVRTGRWEFVSSLTCAGFAVRNFGVKTVRGQLPVRSARVDVDESGRPSGVHATLDVAGIDTGNARRDRDLRGPRLLDVAQYPMITFDSSAIEQVGDTEWVVTGRLAGHGTHVEVSMQVQVTSTRDGGIAVRAVTEFDREALGVTAPRFLIGRRIAVDISATFRTAARAPAHPTAPSGSSPAEAASGPPAEAHR